LLQCGLAFAGCNHGTDGQGNNGILTGEEVLGIDLRGTKLVVLSACETGLGRVRAGEGVASLRQAFQLAGAHTVVATLWSVPDSEMQQLLVLFFGNLTKGMGKAEALAQAQREFIRQQRRATNGITHAFFWAAPTVTGDAGHLR